MQYGSSARRLRQRSSRPAFCFCPDLLDEESTAGALDRGSGGVAGPVAPCSGSVAPQADKVRCVTLRVGFAHNNFEADSPKPLGCVERLQPLAGNFTTLASNEVLDHNCAGPLSRRLET